MGLRIDRQEGEVEEGVQIGAEQESIFDMVVFGATVRVDVGCFEDLFDLAIGDNATALEMNKEFGSKGRLAASDFYGLKRRDAFVLVVGQKRLVGFEIRDAIDVQRDQLMDRLREFGVLLEISEFQFDDVLGFELLDRWDIEEVFGEFDGGIELPIDESDLGVFVLVSEGVFLVFWGEVIGRDDTDSLAGGFSGVGKDTVTRLDIVDEGVDRAG